MVSRKAPKCFTFVRIDKVLIDSLWKRFGGKEKMDTAQID